VVRVLVDGASMSSERIKRVIPLFEEGAVDDDLLNEGDRRLRDYYQRLGYFDVKVDHEQKDTHADLVTIQYHVHLGERRRLESVTVEGNHYFDAATLKEMLAVHAAGGLDHHGDYSQALVSSDIHTLQAVYQNNGFSQVKITAETHSDAQGQAAAKGKPQPMKVVYHIAEGEQQRVGAVRLEGAESGDPEKMLRELNTTSGQLLSPQNLSGDRDELLNDYFNRGFDQVRVEVVQQPEAEDAHKVDVTFRVHEGKQIFVRKVLLTGLEYTRPETVAKAITLHPGDPLNDTALAETQRNMYEFALFNEVDTAIENPTGGESYKTILLQASEARRWALTYGGGFEVQTGTPQNNCGTGNLRSISCGSTPSVSPRVLLDITRNSLFGREQSASLRGTYGLLEQKIDLLYQVPHFYGDKNFGLTVSGGYAKSLDVTTYVASKFESGMRWTEHFNAPGSFLSKANTLIYEFDFRVIKVDRDNLQVALVELTPLATAQTVAGPSLTWIRDTRDSPLDAHRGTYTSFQEFVSDATLGAKVQFNRLDLSNSSFYSFDKGRFVIARNSRYGQERAFGSGSQMLIPLPERLYAGGATSLRGFSLNSAGPRDPETGYPVGGAGTLSNSTEIRFPPPTLPVLGNSVSVVLFHDMGNVFSDASDAWASALRFNQPNRDTCKNPEVLPANSPYNSTGLKSPCSFNYFSHAPGVGMRYHTPVGPIRLDFSYNLNTPIYPVAYNYSNNSAPKTVGEANHFNFFFSLGQTF
jgi:outer membrane protein assembly complex protein YaeT